MPILLILALMWAASLSSCVQNADAFTVVDTHKEYGDKLDINPQVKNYICSQIGCIEHVSIDEFKISGTELKAVRGRLSWKF